MTTKKQTVLVSGASAGIGRATAKELAGQGYNLILLARREEKLAELKQELASQTLVHIIACDINDHKALKKELEQIPKVFGDIDVLINNAGLALGLVTADEALWDDWKIMIETNCLSLAWLTRQLLPSMVSNNAGHVINIGSIAGTYPYKGANVYGATKAFVKQFSLNLKADLLGSQVRVSNIMPGMLDETEFSLVRFSGDKQKADAVYGNKQALKPEDIAETIRWVLAQPAHVNINQIELMPVCQAAAAVAVK